MSAAALKTSDPEIEGAPRASEGEMRRKLRTATRAPVPRSLQAAAIRSILPTAAMLLSACSTPERVPAIGPDHTPAQPASASAAPAVSAAPSASAWQAPDDDPITTDGVRAPVRPAGRPRGGS
jgi:hypothetical protein